MSKGAVKVAVSSISVVLIVY